jgi:purine-binding chemotaxis protein CheW
VTPGFVLFRLGDQTFALSLSETREIVRLTGLEQLPGLRPPMVGVIQLRGNPLPVLDLRGPAAAEDSGDVLVMEVAGDPVGVAVDVVLAVVAAADLPEAVEAAPKTLPPYVIGLRRSAGQPVLLVDLQRMLDVTSEGWIQSLPGGGASILAS